MKEPPFRLGDWVQSTYKARWKGVVVIKEYRRLVRNNCTLSEYWVLGVQQLVDRHGNPIRNKKIKYCHHMNLRPVAPVEGIKPTARMGKITFKKIQDTWQN